MQRTLTIEPAFGLCNRLLAYTSARRLALSSGRTLLVKWNSARACRAHFSELFTDGIEQTTRMPLHSVNFVKWNAAIPSLAREYCQSGQQEIGIRTCYNICGDSLVELGADVDRLHPVHEVLEALSEVSGQLLGVHVRRGDFLRHLKRYNRRLPLSENYFEAIGDWKGRLFLATDDGTCNCHDDIVGRFRQRYGDLLYVRAKPSATRDRVIDAVIDLLILRRCVRVVGTYGSTFSALGAVGREGVFVGAR